MVQRSILSRQALGNGRPPWAGRYRYLTEKGTVVVNNMSEFECQGEILELDPPHILTYTWIANWHDDVTCRTVVRWELTPKLGGTHVKVTHQRPQESAHRAQRLLRRVGPAF
ncbi:MAG TPA: SRPBCC domain-containing protein [Candidatus Acidoferrum sp.]|nr:SRPBCC domain-containing protein [Candidatus Acidoferrum sp.]